MGERGATRRHRENRRENGTEKTEWRTAENEGKEKEKTTILHPETD